MNNIRAYIQSFLKYEKEQLKVLEEEEKKRNDIQPSVGLEVGRFLSLLIKSHQAKRVLEFGTCLGYSTIWLAEALKETGGKLISVEYSEELYLETKKNLEKTNLIDVVELIHGDASKVIQRLDGPFDIILQDSDKKLYTTMLDECIKKTKKYGLIIADDTLFKPMGIPSQFSDPVHEYNQVVFKDERLYSTMLPIGDGIVISTKIVD